MLFLVLLSIQVAMVATTVASTKVFAGLRAWVCARNQPMGDLISCPYCLGVHLAVAIALCLLAGGMLPRLPGPPPVSDFAHLLNVWFTLSWLAGVASGLLCWALGRMDAIHDGGVK